MFSLNEHVRSIEQRDNISIVLGVNGQDGSYAAEHLLNTGMIVIGIGRQKESVWVNKHENYHYLNLNLLDFEGFLEVLIFLKPVLIFNAAAIHGANQYQYENVWKHAHAINTYLTHGILEYIREHNKKCTLLYLSSSKVFDLSPSRVIDEKTEKNGACIYTITKNASTDLMHYYRNKHCINAKVVWTFNHESPRRKAQYFIPKIVDILAKSISDRNYCAQVYTLDFWCDWGDAQEYMKICSKLALREGGHDFILATGKTHWAKTFVEDLFGRYGLEFKKHVKVMLETGEKSKPWRADNSSVYRELGITPTTDIFKVCNTILKENYHQYDIENISGNSYKEK